MQTSICDKEVKRLQEAACGVVGIRGVYCNGRFARGIRRESAIFSPIDKPRDAIELMARACVAEFFDVYTKQGRIALVSAVSNMAR